MKEVAKLQIKDRTELFQATAISMGMQPNVIEKDFWVCFMLDHLFHDCRYKNAFVFKGGTSLSKSYHVIERFSEDIDLILDWRKIINDEVNPWEERSKTKQDIFNKQINSEAAKFYKEELIPQLNSEMKEKLGDGEWISVDTEDEMVVNFYYPQIFETEYLRSCVRLEIGPLAEWMPSHETIVTPFAAEKYPDMTVFTSDYAIVKNKKVITGDKMLWVKRLLRLPLRFHILCGLKWIKIMPLVLGNPICCPATTYSKKRLGEPFVQSEYQFALDWDHMVQLAGEKGRFICVEKPLIYYRVHEGATTNACIKDNRRAREEAEMFARFWPKAVVKLIMKGYSSAYKEYE